VTLAGRRVAVTGATGFLGTRLVPALARAGWRVRVLARRAPAPGTWGEIEPDLVSGDLADSEALERLLAGTDLVIHVAGLIKSRARSAFFAVNEVGARQVARLAPRDGMILVSSLAAREPLLSDYAASKRAGEDAARAALGERLTIVRPPAIYGPGDRETLAMFQLAAASPILPLFGGPCARLTLAHVDEVVGAIVNLAGRAGRPALVSVPGARAEGYGWAEILNTAANAVGRRVRLVPTPSALVMAAGAASEALAALSGRTAIFTRGKAREILHPDWSITPADGLDAGAFASIALDEGFAQTIAWYREKGWLPNSRTSAPGSRLAATRP